ncbi:trigger factor [uncultured Jatrophihabitans sp.]|uniref:trigger factor n=1 Tax=uncultured Jatrophihabitans sp. TaxID=1610747 RepID=UPI0035CB988A
MKSTVENLSPTRVRLAVEVPFDDVKPELDAAYKSIGQQIRIPGFRPGKVPARIIDQRVGRGAVLQEAINEALPRIYTEAAREQEIQPLGQPEIDITNLDDLGSDTASSLNFTAEVDVRPQITLPELDGIAVTVDDTEVTDADVDEQLDELRDRFSTLVGVERPAAEGDYVSLDLVSTVDGDEIEGASAKGRSYVVGSDDFVDGLDAAITGKPAGETVTFTAPLRQGEHAGTEAEIAATVKAVKVKELPEADDEFAQLASEFDTIGELRDDLRARLGNVRTMEQGAQARDRLLEHLVDTVEFPLPESALDAEIEYRQHDIVHSLNHDDDLLNKFLEAQGKTREEWDTEMRESAEKSVRAQFILDAVADVEQVQIGDGELTEYLVRQAQQYQMAPQEFANQIMQSGNLPMLVADIRRNKALASLLESAEVTDASGETVDLAALAGGPEAPDLSDLPEEEIAAAEAADVEAADVEAAAADEAAAEATSRGDASDA